MTFIEALLKSIAFLVIFQNIRASDKPNIVFIVADDIGWNDVGWHNPEIITPHMDRLAEEGVILDSSYVQPVCSPSRAAFMTGYYPYHVGLQHSVILRDRPYGLPLNFTVLPQKLKQLGYSTHLVGKWHLGYCKWEYTPTYRGFDTFYGRYNGRSDYYNHSVGNGFDFRFNKDVVRDQDGKYATFSFANRAVDIVKQHDTTNPLYLYLPFTAPHDPLQVPKKYEDIYKHIKGDERRIFCGMVTAMDEAIGQLVDALRNKGMAENTLIVFSTDNGGYHSAGGRNRPLRGGKTTLFEGGTRGVAFAWGNMLKEKRYVNNRLIHAVDWVPTLLTVAGGEPDEGLDGVNQWPAVSENAPSARNEMIYNINERDGTGAIRIGDYKLIDENINNPEIIDHSKLYLFNLRDDPFELKNLAVVEQSRVASMRRRIQEHMRTLYPAMWPDPKYEAQPENWGGIWSPGWC